jgi:hypothetical protein
MREYMDITGEIRKKKEEKHKAVEEVKEKDAISDEGGSLDFSYEEAEKPKDSPVEPEVAKKAAQKAK